MLIATVSGDSINNLVLSFQVLSQLRDKQQELENKVSALFFIFFSISFKTERVIGKKMIGSKQHVECLIHLLIIFTPE